MRGRERRESKNKREGEEREKVRKRACVRMRDRVCKKEGGTKRYCTS